MPLLKGKGKKAFVQNIKTEIGAGKPQKQAVAIAYSQKRSAEHKAEGGSIDSTKRREFMEKGINREAYSASDRQYIGEDLPAGHSVAHHEMDQGKRESAIAEHKKVLGEMKSMKKPNLLSRGGMARRRMAEGGDVPPHETWKGSKRVYGKSEHNDAPTGPTNWHNRNKSSDLGSGQRKGPEGYPKYQEQAQNQKGIHTPVSGSTGFPSGKGTSRAGKLTKETYAGKPLFSGPDHPAIAEHKKVLGEMQADKGDRRNLAEGGMAEDCPDCCDGMPCEMHGEQDDSHEMDMVGKIMAQRKQMMSQGGQVANSDEPTADFMPNEFDDLHLRDGLEMSDTGANSGDEDGDADNDKRLNDMVAQAMMKRRKQRNPVPA